MALIPLLGQEHIRVSQPSAPGWSLQTVSQPTPERSRYLMATRFLYEIVQSAWNRPARYPLTVQVGLSRVERLWREKDLTRKRAVTPKKKIKARAGPSSQSPRQPASVLPGGNSRHGYIAGISAAGRHLPATRQRGQRRLRQGRARRARGRVPRNGRSHGTSANRREPQSGVTISFAARPRIEVPARPWGRTREASLGKKSLGKI
jgi:hypothetical protein